MAILRPRVRELGRRWVQAKSHTHSVWALPILLYRCCK